jgi:hypothetical protein
LEGETGAFVTGAALTTTNAAALQRTADLCSVRRSMMRAGRDVNIGEGAPSECTSLVQGTRGAVMLEYVVVLLLVAGSACATIVLMGIAMARFFDAQEAWISIPIP